MQIKSIPTTKWYKYILPYIFGRKYSSWESGYLCEGYFDKGKFYVIKLCN